MPYPPQIPPFPLNLDVILPFLPPSLSSPPLSSPPLSSPPLSSPPLSSPPLSSPPLSSPPLFPHMSSPVPPLLAPSPLSTPPQMYTLQYRSSGEQNLIMTIFYGLGLGVVLMIFLLLVFIFIQKVYKCYKNKIKKRQLREIQLEILRI